MKRINTLLFNKNIKNNYNALKTNFNKFLKKDYNDKIINFYVEKIIPIAIDKKDYKYTNNILEKSLHMKVNNCIIPYNTNNTKLLDYYKIDLYDILYIILFDKTNINMIDYLNTKNIKLSLENLNYIFIKEKTHSLRSDYSSIFNRIIQNHNNKQALKSFLILNYNHKLFNNIHKVFNVKNHYRDINNIILVDDKKIRRKLLDNYLKFYKSIDANFNLILYMIEYLDVEEFIYITKKIKTKNIDINYGRYFSDNKYYDKIIFFHYNNLK